MKKYLLLIFLSGLLSLSFAQQQPISKEEPKTKLEKFISKEGNLIIKEVLESQTLKGNLSTQITFKSMKISQPGQETNTIKGIKIGIAELSRSRSETIAFLDIDEIESLIKAVDYIIESGIKLKAEKKYIEVIFKTRGDFELGIFIKEDGETTLFANINKYPYPSYYADLEDINQIKTILSSLSKTLL
ncbi:MAG: hypothetical protein NTX65_03235 [Ignavibacteriales bacterium]|nr:hypothetical protein [Ignavibacteriales bacterium]